MRSELLIIDKEQREKKWENEREMGDFLKMVSATFLWAYL